MISRLRSLFGNKGFIKYFKNTSWLFAEKILRMFVGLFVGIWVTRYLGPEQFGLLSYAQSFVGLFSVIATLGLNSIVVRELVKKEIDQDVLIGTSFWMMLFASFFILILLWIAVHFTSNDFTTNILIFIIASGTIFQCFNVIDFYFQSNVMSKYIVYANMVTLLITSSIKILLIISGAPLIAFAIVVVLDSFIMALGYTYVYLRQKQLLKNWKFDYTTAKTLLISSSPLIIAGVINSIYMKIDQVMIQEMMGSVEVGYYAAAVRLSEVWFGVGVIICNSLFPAIVNAKKISEKLYYERLSNLFMLLIIMAYIVSLFVFFFSDDIINILYGIEYSESSNVLSIHIFSAIFVYLGVSSGRWLIAEDKTMLNFYRNLLGLITNILLNIFFIERYGIIGAAYASLFSYIVAFYFFDLLFQSTRKIFILKTKLLLFLRN